MVNSHRRKLVVEWRKERPEAPEGRGSAELELGDHAMAASDPSISKPEIAARLLSVSGILAAAAFFLLGSTVLADGGFFVKFVGEATDVAASMKQEAFIVRDGEEVQVTLRTHFRTGPPELAWVIPVPKKPDRVEKADDQLFSILQEWTAPKFWAMGRSKRGLGCGCGGGGAESIAGSVSVLESGTAGIFDYTVLTATGSNALTQWLEKNGYAMPSGSEQFIKPYVDRGWYWLAVQIRADKREEHFLAPHPIRYTYRDDGKLVYPLVISRLSAHQENEVVLYVLSNSRFKCENWSNLTIREKDLALDKSSPSGTNYEKLLQEAIPEEGGHAFVTECALEMVDTEGFRPLLRATQGEGPLKPWLAFLTRLRTVVTPAKMNRDVILVPSGSASVDREHYLRVPDAKGNWTGVIATVAVITLLILVSKRVRRFVSP
jgi:hypothetical protein